MKKSIIKKIAIVSSLSLLTSVYAHADTVKLENNAKHLKDIVPVGWKVLDVKKGDLNKDGITDMVFAIQDTRNIKIDKDIPEIRSDNNPRKMAIYFGTKSGIFKKQFSSDSFIILKEQNMQEPFEGFSISRKGVLSMKFIQFANSGSWSSSNHEYKFRFKNSDFLLIGYESESAHRGNGETVVHSINFLNKKMSTQKSNFINKKKPSTKWSKFKLTQPITIHDIAKKPLEYKFEGLYL